MKGCLYIYTRPPWGSHAKSYNCQQYLSGPKVLNLAGKKLEVEFDNFKSTQDKKKEIWTKEYQN